MSSDHADLTAIRAWSATELLIPNATSRFPPDTMEEGKRILSLRKKRSVKPKISAPKQISAPISQPPLPTQSLQLPSRPSFQSQHSNSSVNTTATARPRADGHTADYVKRRYSTKIPQLPPGFGEAPALPSVPSQFLSTPPARSEARGARGYSAGDPLAVDLQALHNPDLKPEQCMSILFMPTPMANGHV